jgi:hypothetical protein
MTHRRVRRTLAITTTVIGLAAATFGTVAAFADQDPPALKISAESHCDVKSKKYLVTFTIRNGESDRYFVLDGTSVQPGGSIKPVPAGTRLDPGKATTVSTRLNPGQATRLKVAGRSVLLADQSFFSAFSQLDHQTADTAPCG